MIAVQGRIQREGEVVHLVANPLTDLSADLAGIGDQDAGFPLSHGRGDEVHHGSPGIDPRSAADWADASGHLRAGPARRQHQGENPGFQMNPSSATNPRFAA